MNRTDDDASPVTTQVGYATWAADYDRQDNPMTAIAAHVLALPSPDLGGAAVLELGCGTGRNAAALRSLGCASYLGIDSSPEMLAVARSRCADDDGVSFLERDLRDRWWSDLEPAGVVLISLVLEHFERAAPIIEALRHVTHPGSQAWILELHPHLHAAGVRAHVAHDGRNLALPSYAHPAAELVDAFAGIGWEPLSVTDRYATTDLTRLSPKLARYLGRPVLLDLRAQRPALSQ
jgi:malonyl-CoA O-methyltransferase